ncbi:MAG: hypothetical protein NWQ43_12060 [Dolichospermum sp.]|uniref:hypothetical protein n=1 Tax=Anabaena sp. UHCC 0187 TaxID=2590018 RepID=UPI001446E6A8|nr:hypothetical protein [Anabaena sp. UHCC 0187]MDP5018020.1 hypothetical protein [Dolichospermum sp.]
MNMTFINHNQLQISWELHEKFLAVNTQKTIIIPLDHVVAVSTEPPISQEPLIFELR